MSGLLEILQGWVTMGVGIVYGSVTAGCIWIKSRCLIAAIELVEPEVFEEVVLYGGECRGLIEATEV